MCDTGFSCTLNERWWHSSGVAKVKVYLHVAGSLIAVMALIPPVGAHTKRTSV